MREFARDKGRLEDIVHYSSNVLKIIDSIDLKEQVEKYLTDIDWDKYLEQ